MVLLGQPGGRVGRRGIHLRRAVPFWGRLDAFLRKNRPTPTAFTLAPTTPDPPHGARR
jgi:hypothetical protein